ncbi:MAG: hypothetical protein RLZZ231_1430 [Bacteroidota bacterium]
MRLLSGEGNKLRGSNLKKINQILLPFFLNKIFTNKFFGKNIVQILFQNTEKYQIKKIL